jgi:xanthine/uracil permease
MRCIASPSACGALYTLIGLAVMATGTRWIESLMPPVVTGAVVAVIGLNLAGIPVKNMAPTPFDAWMQGVTFVCVAGVAVFTRGMTQRLLILVGLIVAAVVYAVLTNGMGLGKPIDFSGIAGAAWFGAPRFASPVFDANAVLLIAILLGFSPKFGALIQAIPLAVMGGVSIVVFGLIAVAGAKIWVDNRVDFSDNRNLVVAAITLVLGTGDYTLKFGGFTLGGIGTATFGAILLWALLGRGGAAR